VYIDSPRVVHIGTASLYLSCFNQIKLLPVTYSPLPFSPNIQKLTMQYIILYSYEAEKSNKDPRESPATAGKRVHSGSTLCYVMRIRHSDVETRGNAQSIQAAGILLLFFGSQEQLRPPTHHTLSQFLALRLNTESQSSPGEAGNCEDIRILRWFLPGICVLLAHNSQPHNPKRSHPHRWR
jgi:hypothetical protein